MSEKRRRIVEHQAVGDIDARDIEKDWRGKFQVSRENAQEREKLVRTLELYSNMGYGHSGFVSIKKSKI